MGHARALLGFDDPDEQMKVCDEILKRRLSVRQVEALVQELQAGIAGKAAAAGQTPGKPTSRRKEPWLIEIEETLAESLTSPVQIRYTPKRASITIECLGREEFERVYELLKDVRKDHV